MLVFFKAAVIWVLFGGLFCFVLQFHSILDQSFSLSSLLWNVVNTNLKEGVGRYVNCLLKKKLNKNTEYVSGFVFPILFAFLVGKCG